MLAAEKERVRLHNIMGNLIKTLSPSAAHARSRPIENDVSDLLYLYMVKKYGDMNGSEHYQNILKNMLRMFKSVC